MDCCFSGENEVSSSLYFLELYFRDKEAPLAGFEIQDPFVLTDISPEYRLAIYWWLERINSQGLALTLEKTVLIKMVLLLSAKPFNLSDMKTWVFSLLVNPNKCVHSFQYNPILELYWPDKVKDWFATKSHCITPSSEPTTA